jgi:hypothetical protein
MDHVYKHCVEAFKGTPREKTWVLYHDALSQWWEAESQVHAEAIGLRGHQLRAWGETNSDNPR